MKQIAGWCWAHMVGQYLECDYYDPENCNPAKGHRCNATKQCTSEKSDEYRCYVLWSVTGGKTSVKMKVSNSHSKVCSKHIV